MKMEETIVNVIFDAAKGTASVSSREAVSGKPFGALPRPVRSGYSFEGWYLNGELVTEATVLNSDEDVRLVAQWAKKKGSKKTSMLKRQKIAVAILAVLVVVLTVTLLIVNHVVEIYPLTDTYYVDGVEYNDRYLVKKKNGVYGLYDKNGNAMEVNEDGYYIAIGSGNQYKIDAETGEWELYAVVDYDSAGGELLGFSDRIMMFPQITQKNTYSIEVTNEHGTYLFYRDKSGTVHIKGTEESLVAYDPTLFASLCVSCGYTLTMQKLDLISPGSMAPRLADGSVDYSAYGLADLYDAEGNLTYTPATYTVTKAIYAEDGTCSADPNTKYTVKVGDAILSGGGYYVQLAGRDAVYIVSSDIQKTVLQPVEALVTPSVVYPMTISTYMMIQNFILGDINLTGIWNVSEEEGNKLLEERLKNDKPLVAFTYLDLESRTNTLNTSRPYLCGDLMSGYEINDDNASSVMSLFYEMEFIACKKLGITKEAMAECYLDGEVYYMTFASPVLDDSNSIIGYVDNFLMISQKTPNGTYYIASTLYDMIVEVDPYYLSFLAWEESDWYDQYFFQHNISYISSIDLKIKDVATNSFKEFNFTLDNSYSYMYYEVDGTMKQIDLSKGSVSRGENNEVIYTHSSGVKYNVKSFDFANGAYYIKITEGDTTSYEPFYKYLITIDRDGNRKLQIIRKGDGDAETKVDYDLTYTQNGSVKVKATYSLIYRDASGEEYNVLGAYSASDGNTYKDYYRLSYWQEVKTTDEKGAAKYVWERTEPINSSSYLSLQDQSGKTYDISIGSNNLLVYSEQYQDGKSDPNLLDYTIVHTYETDTGKEKTETISAVDNFRKLYSDLMWYSIEGDVDPEEFEKNMNMSMEDYIKQGDSVCQAIFSYRVADMADTMNLITDVSSSKEKDYEIKTWVENNEMDVVIRFYRYSERKSMITIEVIENYDENGNPISNPENAAGRFYVLSAYLDRLLGDAERLLAGERVEQD